MTGPVVLEIVREFHQPPEAVYDAWVDPGTAGRWLFATAGGEMRQVEIDARVGGGFLVVERRGGEDVEHHGEYLVLERPRRLVFNFWPGPERPAEPSRVTIDIEPLSDGCRLTLTHEMDPQWEAWTEKTREGWAMILGNLAGTLGR